MDTALVPPEAQLAAFRTVYCAAVALILVARLPEYTRFLRTTTRVEKPPRVLAWLPLPQLGAGASLGVGALTTIALLAASAGLWPAVVLAVAAVGALLYFAQVVQHPAVRRKANTIPVILWLLAAASLVPGTPDPRVAPAVLFTIKLLVAQIYFSAGLAKLRAAGWRWSDGKTLRAWLVHYHLRDDSPLALAAASSASLCRCGAGTVLFFELTFWLVIPFPALAWIYVPLGILFHAATALLMRIHYWIHLGPAYLVFVAPGLASASGILPERFFPW